MSLEITLMLLMTILSRLIISYDKLIVGIGDLVSA